MGIFLWTMWDFCFLIIASKDGMPNHRRRDAELIQTATGDGNQFANCGAVITRR
jgi:hypothetical protein